MDSEEIFDVELRGYSDIPSGYIVYKVKCTREEVLDFATIDNDWIDLVNYEYKTDHEMFLIKKSDIQTIVVLKNERKENGTNR